MVLQMSVWLSTVVLLSTAAYYIQILITDRVKQKIKNTNYQKNKLYIYIYIILNLYICIQYIWYSLITF